MIEQACNRDATISGPFKNVLYRSRMGKKCINLAGRRFGRWTVIERAPNEINKVMWLCKCSCRTIQAVASHTLRTGKSVSCGCEPKLRVPRNRKRRSEATRKPRHSKPKNDQPIDLNEFIADTASKPVGRPFIDISGVRFGQLIAIGRDSRKVPGDAQVKWICRCDCGNMTSVKSGNLRRGLTASCGCRNNKSGGPRKAKTDSLREFRHSKSMTIGELSDTIGASRSAIASAEFRGGALGGRGTTRLAARALHRISNGICPLPPVGISTAACRQCGQLFTRKSSIARSHPMRFCSHSCAARYRWHGQGAKRSDRYLSPATVSQFTPIARESKRVDAWAGMKKVLRPKEVHPKKKNC